MTASSELRSCGRPARSAAVSSSTSGWQTALPATTRVRTRCAATVSQTCLGSSRPRRAVTTRPPTSSAPMQLKRPVACISGTTGIITGDRSSALAVRAIATISSSVPGGSSTPSRRKTETCIDCSRSARCQITPLGLPVVPPVYMKS